MYFNSSKILFLQTMLVGILMSTSSNNWIMIWCGLEISLISFIPLLINKKLISSESMMKYFIVQSLSSSMLMLGVLVMVMSGDYNYDYLLTSSLMIKMGVAPFHNWVLTVLEGLDLTMVVLMLTLNKIAPLTLMSYINNQFNMIIIVTMMTGAIMGLNQNSIKKVIGYSSIFNMGLMLIVLKITLMWMFYLLIYSMMILLLIISLKKNNMKFINQIMFSQPIINKLTLWINLLSMGGMPPLIGFAIKYMVMMYLISKSLIMMSTVLILSSLVVMFFYLRMSFASVLNYSMMNSTNMFNLKEMSMWMLNMNTLMIPILMFIKTLIVL